MVQCKLFTSQYFSLFFSRKCWWKWDWGTSDHLCNACCGNNWELR